jgi:hypothetical protein
MAKISRRKKRPKHKLVVDLETLISNSHEIVGLIGYLIPDANKPRFAEFRATVIKILDTLTTNKLNKPHGKN